VNDPQATDQKLIADVLALMPAGRIGRILLKNSYEAVTATPARKVDRSESPTFNDH